MGVLEKGWTHKFITRYVKTLHVSAFLLQWTRSCFQRIRKSLSEALRLPSSSDLSSCLFSSLHFFFALVRNTKQSHPRVTGADWRFAGLVAVQSMSKHTQAPSFVSSLKLSLHGSIHPQVRSSTRSRCMTPAWRRLIACPWQPWWTSSSFVCMGGFHQRSTRWTTSKRYNKKTHAHTSLN